MGKYISLKQAEEIFGVNRHTLRIQAQNAGCLYKIGRAVRIDLPALTEALKQQTERRHT